MLSRYPQIIVRLLYIKIFHCTFSQNNRTATSNAILGASYGTSRRPPTGWNISRILPMNANAAIGKQGAIQAVSIWLGEKSQLTFQSNCWISVCERPKSSLSTSSLSRRLLSAFCQNRRPIDKINMHVEVARLRPFPMWYYSAIQLKIIKKFEQHTAGASNGRKDQVEMSPPMEPNITLVPTE